MLYPSLPTLAAALLSVAVAGPVAARQGEQMPELEPAPVTDPRPLSFRQLEWDHGVETSWQRWWTLEQERFLDLRGLARRGDTATDSDALGALWAARVEGVDAPTRAQKEYLIYPGLEKLRNASADRDVQSEVLLALGRLGMHGDSSTQLLRDYLRAPSRDLAQSAILALGLLGHDAAWPTLRSLIVDDAHGRWLSGDGSGVQSEKRAWACLAAGIGSPGWSTADQAELGAVLLQIAGESTLVDDLRASALLALACVPTAAPQERVDLLLGLLHDRKQPQVIREVAPTVIARSARGDEAAEALARAELSTLLSSRSPATVRQSAILAFGLLTPPAPEQADPVGDTLGQLVRGARTPLERHYAAIALSRQATQSQDVEQIHTVAALLVDQLDDASPEQRGWAAIALGQLGFEQQLWSGISRVRAERALLAVLTEDKHDGARAASAIALGLLGQQNAARTLTAICAADDHPSLRGYAAIALGLLGQSEAEELLLEQLDRAAHDPSLLERTTVGLALLGSEEVHGRLLRMLDPDGAAYPTLAEVTSAARGISLIGDARTAPFLLTAMDDETLTTKSRALAARALGILADHEDRPWQLRLAEGLHHLAVPSSVLDWKSGNGVLNRR